MKIINLIKEGIKRFKKGGMMIFIRTFNPTKKRIEGNTMYLGKFQDITFNTNGQSLMGYIKSPETIKFVFNSFGKKPWTSKVNNEARNALFNVVNSPEFKSSEVYENFRTFLTICNNYGTIADYFTSKNIVPFRVLNEEQQNYIERQRKMKKEAASDKEGASDKKVVSDKKDSSDKELNVMQLAHKIRREEHLEGHYHAQMKYALKVAYSILHNKRAEKEVVDNSSSTSSSAVLTEKDAIDMAKKYPIAFWFTKECIHVKQNATEKKFKAPGDSRERLEARSIECVNTMASKTKKGVAIVIKNKNLITKFATNVKVLVVE